MLAPSARFVQIKIKNTFKLFNFIAETFPNELKFEEALHFI
jgi:hypothetical protein